MTDQQSFERELQAVLEDLAPDRAPEALVSRVAMIPLRERSARRSLAGFGSRFLALAAAAAVALVVAVVVLPSFSPPDPIGGGPATPSPTPIPSPSASPPAPSVTPAPTDQASSGATSSPSSASTGAGIPDDFQPVSVTFASPDEGWVLGEAPCSGSPCAWVLHTTDAGRSWAAIGAPDTTVVSSRSDTVSSGVTTLRFADPDDGWAFGPQELWRTHDSGGSWIQVTLPGLHEDRTIVALEADGGLAQAVVLDCGPEGCAFVIETSPVESDDWQLAPLKLPVGGGPVPTAQLVLHGSDGWLIQIDRVVVNGARLSGGQWREWQPPCADVQGPAVLAASSATELVAACNVGEWAEPQGQHLFVSHDGGRTFSEADTPLPLATINGVAAASESVIALAGSTEVRSEIEATFDSGQTWLPVFEHTPDATFADLGFTTRSQGVAIVSDPDANDLLLMTRDGGRTWRSVSF
jgi:photosystem II stability/assembly factor-like uncharacterized protein